VREFRSADHSEAARRADAATAAHLKPFQQPGDFDAKVSPTVVGGLLVGLCLLAVAIAFFVATSVIGSFGWWFGSYVLLMAAGAALTAMRGGVEGWLEFVPAAWYMFWVWVAGGLAYLVFHA
jgi:hypothetical protein